MKPTSVAPTASTTSGADMIAGDSWMWCWVSASARVSSPENTRK